MKYQFEVPASVDNIQARFRECGLAPTWQLDPIQKAAMMPFFSGALLILTKIPGGGIRIESRKRVP